MVYHGPGSRHRRVGTPACSGDLNEYVAVLGVERARAHVSWEGARRGSGKVGLKRAEVLLA